MIRFSCVSMCRHAKAAGLSSLLLIAAGTTAQAQPMGPMQPDAGQWGQPQPRPDEPSAQDQAIDAARRAHDDPLRYRGDNRQQQLLEGINRLKRAGPADETPVAAAEQEPKLKAPPPAQQAKAPPSPPPPVQLTNPSVVESPVPPPPIAAPPAFTPPEPLKTVEPDNLIQNILIGLVALGVLIALGGLLFARRKPKDDPETHDDDDDTTQDDVIIPVGEPKPRHHCQGHRLGVVIGPKSNDSLERAMDWLASQDNIQHKIHINAANLDSMPPDFREISIISAAGNKAYKGPPPPPPPKPQAGQKPVKPKPLPPGEYADKYFEVECTCCCHWDEVIIFAHGHQQYLWYALLNHIPQLLNDRPARKVVLWICGAAGAFFPNKPIDVEGREGWTHLKKFEKQPVFEQVAWLLRPKSCHIDTRCGCDKDNCESYDADGTHGGKCPDGREPVTMVCGAWYGARINEDETSGDVPISAALGINYRDDATTGQRTWYLTSPDGRIRTVHIAPPPAGGGEAQEGSAVTTDAPGDPGNILGGTQLAPEDGLKKAKLTNLDKISSRKRVADTTTKKPPQNIVANYGGGRHCEHDEREGCQPNAV
jgi:hypothetical protein